MKKVSVLFSLLVIFVLALSACSSPEEENTGELEATGTLGGLEETAAPGLATSTLLPTATAGTGTGGEGGAGAATATSTLATTAQATEVMTGTTGAPEAVEDISRMSVLLGTNIQGQGGEDIGEVENAILDFCNAQATYIIAGFGGFLNIGENEVAIPWDAFQISEIDPDGDGVITRGLTLNVTEEQLDNAPEFDASGIDLDAPDWDAEINNYWNTQIEGTGAVTGTTGTEVQATQPVTGTTGTEGSVTADRCTVLAEDLLDLGIVTLATTGTDATGAAMTGTPAAGGAAATGTPEVDELENIGDVQDVILDPTTGDIQYVVLSVDAFDLNGNWVLVPPQAITLVDQDPDDDDLLPDALVLHISQEDLVNAPNFESDALPDTSVEGWDVDVNTYWTGVDIDVQPENAP